MLLWFCIYFKSFLERGYIIQETFIRGASLMFLLITEWTLLKKNLLQTFSNKSSKSDYQWNITITSFAKFRRILSRKLHTNPLKFHPLCRLLPLHGCNLAFTPDNYNALKYLPSEISLFQRPTHNSLLSRFVMVFSLSLSPFSRSAGPL